MRPSLIQCFPHPFTRQWPNTGNPVTCECRQLYALVSVCCCVPNTHLLVLHEGAHVSSNMITSMPKGPKYVDYRITSRTTTEDFCGFLLRAEAAASGSAHGSTLADESSAFSHAMDEVYSATSVTTPHTGEHADGAVASPHSVLRKADAAVSSPLARSRSGPAQRQVVVVCLHGIADASAAVQSALMDVLCFEQVRSHHRAMRVPTLRVVAFCACRNFALLLPETLRAAFTLSTYVSTLSIESAVVLQTNNVASSNIINKRFMLEVMTSPDGQPLLETVTLSGSVLRYMRHLLLVVRGSLCAAMSPGALALRRIPKWTTVLRAMAVLFMPDESLLRSRALHLRPTLLHSYTTRASTMVGGERVPHSALYRATNSSTHRAASPQQQQQQQQHNIGSSYALPASRRNMLTVEETDDAEDSTGPSPIESFSNVVVSPSDVACVFSSLMGHLMTVPREMVPSEEIMTATNAMMGPAGGSSSVVDAYVNMLDAQRRGKGGFSFQDPTMWDAVAASWSLRHLHGLADPIRDPADTLGGSFVSSNALQMSMMNNNNNGTFNEAERAAMESRNANFSRFGSPSPDALTLGGSPASRDAYANTLSNRPLSTLADVWKSSATENYGLLDTASTPMLDYWEVREVMRATLICRSAPAPG